MLRSMNRRMGVALAVCVAVGGLMAGGCSTTKLGTGEKAAETLLENAELIRAGEQDIKATMASLEAFQSDNAEELPVLFKTFSDQMEDLEKTAAKVSATNDKMAEAGKAYFETWTTELDTIANDDIRERSADRLERTEKAIDGLKGDYEKMVDTYREYIGDLRDIETVLELSLNAESVESMSKTMKKAIDKGESAIKAAEKVAERYESLGLKMSAVGAARSS